jgi:2-iminobutanoate/2-iminopropanoate deaminase
VEGGIAAQAHQVMKNLAAILEAAGSELDQIVKTSVFLSNLDDFSGFNRVYKRIFWRGRGAARHCSGGTSALRCVVAVEAIAID